MDASFDALRDTGLHLQSLLLYQRAKATQSGDLEAAGRLTEQFREINTTTRSIDRASVEQINATTQQWKNEIESLGGG